MTQPAPSFVKAPGDRRNFPLLILGNVILGAPMPMMIILGGLSGVLLAPLPGMATLPPSVQMLAGLLAAGPMSMLMGRYGRKAGFLTGAALAAAGGLCGSWALFLGDFWLLCAAHVPLGMALVCFAYFRFAAAETVPEKWQPTAISILLGSGLIAALLGPEIFILTRDAFLPVPFAGAYLALTGLAAAGAVPVAFLRLGRPGAQAATETCGSGSGSRPALGPILRRPGVAAAIIAAALSQGIMVLLMTPTPLAMVGCGFSDVQAGDVIRWHVIAMFAPGFVTGLLITRFGAARMIACGLLLLAGAAGIAIAGIELENFYLSLVLLGIGWNFGFIGATSLLASQLATNERSTVQGINDTLVALSATLTSFGSGALIAGFGWATVSWAALPLLALGLLVLLRPGMARQVRAAG